MDLDKTETTAEKIVSDVESRTGTLEVNSEVTKMHRSAVVVFRKQTKDNSAGRSRRALRLTDQALQP